MKMTVFFRKGHLDPFHKDENMERFLGFVGENWDKF